MSSSYFGPGSVFKILYNLNAYNLLLGKPFVGGATFCHDAEELCQVPYRHREYCDGKVVDQYNRCVETRFSMFVRCIETSYEFVNTWEVLWDDLLAHGLVHYTQHNVFTPILLLSVRDGLDLWAERLKNDPYYVAKKVLRT